MDELYLDNVKKIAYFLWEYTGYDDALKHWYCAEDMACYLEEFDFTTLDRIQAVLKKDVQSDDYVHFIRNIAFRIHIYSNNNDDLYNWFCAEKLTSNSECLHAFAWVANYFNKRKAMSGFMSNLRSDKVRNYYNQNNFFA